MYFFFSALRDVCQDETYCKGTLIIPFYGKFFTYTITIFSANVYMVEDFFVVMLCVAQYFVPNLLSQAVRQKNDVMSCRLPCTTR